MISMKKKVMLFVVLIALVSTLVLADPRRDSSMDGVNQFQDIIDLFGDLIEFVGDIFTMDALKNPNTAFGIFLFMFWLVLTTLLTMGTRRLFGTTHQRQATIISVALSTMIIVMLNFERDLLVNVLGNWMGLFFMFLSAAAIGLPVVLVHAIFGRPTTTGQHIAYFIAYFLALMLSLNVSSGINDWIRFLDQFVTQTKYVAPAVIGIQFFMKRTDTK